MEKEKSIKLNFMKIVVTLLVVYAHATRMFTANSAITGPYYVSNFFLENITNFIYGFHMPFFFFISGLVYSLCIKDGKYKEKKQFIKNKFLRLMIPYFIFGLLYVVPIMYALNVTGQGLGVYIFNIIFLGDSRHLWFLPTLFIIFIISMFIKPKNKKQCLITVLLMIIVAYFAKYFPAVIYNVMYYCVYFYVGYLFNFLYENIYEMKKNKIILILLSLLIVYGVMFYFNFDKILLAIVGCVMMFFMLYSVNTNIYSNKKLFKLLKDNSMGIYLFHPMIIYIIYDVFKDIYFNPYLFSFISALVSLIISIFLTYIIKKVKLGVILGEK